MQAVNSSLARKAKTGAETGRTALACTEDQSYPAVNRICIIPEQLRIVEEFCEIRSFSQKKDPFTVILAVPTADLANFRLANRRHDGMLLADIAVIA